MTEISKTTKVQGPRRGARIGSLRRLGASVSALAASASLLFAGSAMADFGVQPGSFTAEVNDQAEQPYTQAGGHPYSASTSFTFNTKTNSASEIIPDGVVKDIVAELPPGFAGNPQAVPQCSEAEFKGGFYAECPAATQVGRTVVNGALGTFREVVTVPVYNMKPGPGQPALFAFKALATEVHLVPTVRASGDYGLTVTVPNVSQQLTLFGTKLTFWGVPADPSHTPERGENCEVSAFFSQCSGGGKEAGIAPRPFLSNPTNCTSGPPLTTLRVDPVQSPGDFLSYFASSPVPTGCNELDFAPTIQARPTTPLADSPSGLEFTFHLPQSEDPGGLATAHLKDAVVNLPAGLTVNAAAANGLGACTPAQVGLITPVGQAAAHFAEGPTSCPAAARLGTVEVRTPLLGRPLEGSVYLASQGQNPFGSLLAIYLAIEDPETGLFVKIPGEVRADSASGQLTARFSENPQLPIEDIKVDFFEGSSAALKTPATCGSFKTTTTLTPWSTPEGANATPSDSFSVTQGADGGACVGTEAAAPNSPRFTAGTVDPTAGAFTPFVLKLARADGTQRIKAIDTTLPKGLLGKLAGTPYCSDASLAAAQGKSGRAEQASSSCPAASQVGSVDVAAGAGPSPYYAAGKAYLAGPYKGAPLSLAIVTPAVAGPFDLGNVVVRAALDVNPETAQIHAVSDPIPTILQGIPLDVRSIALKVDKPSFTLNPTSCKRMSVDGLAISAFGQNASLSNPFQVGDCGLLGFKPSLAIRLKGGTKRSGHPALTATLTARPGDANIARTVVALPHSEFLAQDHIKTICTRVQYAADQCPAGSIYGSARAFSPLLDNPLEGPVYLRSSSNKLPDLVVALQGQIDIDLVGRIDSAKGGIRTSFESVPDAPVSKFVLSMQGGKKGLLENSRNLCAGTNRATVQMDAQSGKTADSRPVVKSVGCKGKKKHTKQKHHGKPAKKG
jgi:hypothetical protein